MLKILCTGFQEGRSNLQKKKGEQKSDFEYLGELGSEKKTSLVHSLKIVINPSNTSKKSISPKKTKALKEIKKLMKIQLKP